MAVKVRLSRIGAKMKPVYKVVATDVHNRRDGKYLEDLGRYDPNPTPAVIKIKKDRVDYWVSKGAQVTNTVAKLIREQEKRAKA